MYSRKRWAECFRSQYFQKQPRRLHLYVSGCKIAADGSLGEAQLSGHGGCVSPLEVAHDESPQGPQGDAHGRGGHEQPNDGQCIRGVVLGHKLALKEEPECQKKEPPVRSLPRAPPLRASGPPARGREHLRPGILAHGAAPALRAGH